MPMSRAAHNWHMGVVRILLDSGADIGAKDNHERTALYRARTNGHDEAVELLEIEGWKFSCRSVNDGKGKDTGRYKLFQVCIIEVLNTPVL